MPPLLCNFLPDTPAERWASIQLSYPSLGAVITHASHATQLLGRSKSTSHNRYGQNNGPQTPLDKWQLVGTVIGSVAGTAILFWILYYCWEKCKPRPTYLEAAIELEKKREKSEAKAKKRWPQFLTRRIASMRSARPVAVDDVTPPPAASIRSSFYSDEGQMPQ
ncbi:hypothetical protein GGR51DRAFT_366730 [Nemania sp. FL0031]|nr:hypothetical protein GGR51DRAFT_366730 [Nemania sp. FL0031]